MQLTSSWPRGACVEGPVRPAGPEVGSGRSEKIPDDRDNSGSEFRIICSLRNLRTGAVLKSPCSQKSRPPFKIDRLKCGGFVYARRYLSSDLSPLSSTNDTSTTCGFVYVKHYFSKSIVLHKQHHYF